MALRARLALFFIAITVVPLTVALIALELQVAQRIDQRAQGEVATLQRAALDHVALRRARAADLGVDVAMGSGSGAALTGMAQAEEWLTGVLGDGVGERADVVVLADADGELVAALASAPAGAAQDVFPSPSALAAAAPGGETVDRVLVEVTEVRGQAADEPERLLGFVVVGTWVDEDLLAGAAVGEGAALYVDGEVVTSVGADPTAFVDTAIPRVGGTVRTSIGAEAVLVGAQTLPGAAGAGPQVELLVWTPLGATAGPRSLALLVLVPAVLAAGGLGWVLAGGVVAPVRRAADVARAVADGDLDQTLTPTGGRELADLAHALNTMSAELGTRLAELERGKEELRRSLARLGESLSSSLDLDRTLDVVVSTAMATLAGDRAALMQFTPERDALYAKVSLGLEGPPPWVAIGAGLAGTVAQTGASVRLPADADHAPAVAAGELTGPHQLAVPMLGRGRIMGVLSLVRDDPAEERAFTQDDLDTVRSFAAQASVAIENVVLHEEAQRLSVTDSLTGLWNFRYFQLQADRELGSATRFARPLSVVILDLDHFKMVNDEHGHLVGDDVLVEVAQRLRDATRVPDVVARYGGEEFVVLLPTTDAEGAVATAERIRQGIARLPITVGAATGAVGSLAVTCSAGVATFPQHGRDIAALLRAADAAMYEAKSHGRNRVVGAAGQPV